MSQLFKLILLTILIPIIKTKGPQYKQELDYLSKEQNLSNDSRPSRQQKAPEIQELNGNFVDDNGRPNLGEQTIQRQKRLNRNPSRGRKGKLQEQKTLKHQSHQKRNLTVTRNSREQKTKEHSKLNKNLVDGDSSRQEQKTEHQSYQKQTKARIQIETKNKSDELHRILLNEDLVPSPLVEQKIPEQHDRKPGHINERTMVTDNQFAYMAAVMKGGTYVSAGALIDESWVLTAADGVYFMKEAIRFLRIRLGSINYKKGGTLFHVKDLEVHPYFNSSQPTYDLALIMLSMPVRLTPTIKSIRLQIIPKEVTATHFIVTSWPVMTPMSKGKTTQILSADIVKRHRILSVTHLHPSDPEDCAEELMEIGADNAGVMCLETVEKDACTRDVGAPVVINGVLWGIISSWMLDDCDEEDAAPIFASVVSAKDISTWIHATVHGHRWNPKYK